MRVRHPNGVLLRVRFNLCSYESLDVKSKMVEHEKNPLN